MKKNSILKVILPIIILAIAGGGFLYLKDSKQTRKKPQLKEKIWQVEVVQARLETIAPELSLFATIEAPRLQKMAAPTAARVQNVKVKIGQSVQKGDLLIQLDPQDFVYKLQQTKADVDDVKSQIIQLEVKNEADFKTLDIEKQILKLAQQDLNRAKRVQQKGLGSESGLSDAQNKYAKQQLSLLSKQTEVMQFDSKMAQLKAKLSRVLALFSQAKINQSRSFMKASFDGVINELNVAQGDYVKSAQVLISLYPKQNLEARTRVPAKYQQQIQTMLQQNKIVRAVSSLNGDIIDLELDRLSGHASANGIDVYFKLNQAQESIRLGQFLRLKVILPMQDHVMQIPLQALYGVSRLYIMQEDRLKAVDVKVLSHGADTHGVPSALIFSAQLSNEMQIVTTHLPNAVEGLKVSLKASAEIKTKATKSIANKSTVKMDENKDKKSMKLKKEAETAS